MNERQLQHLITQYLQYLQNARRLYFIRANVFNGKIQRKDGSIGWMKNGSPGLSDLLVFMPEGRAVFIELKSERGNQSYLQECFERDIKALGYEYYVVKSQSELENVLGLNKK